MRGKKLPSDSLRDEAVSGIDNTALEIEETTPEMTLPRHFWRRVSSGPVAVAFRLIVKLRAVPARVKVANKIVLFMEFFIELIWLRLFSILKQAERSEFND